MGETISEQKARKEREEAQKEEKLYFLYDKQTDQRVFEAWAKDGDVFLTQYDAAVEHDPSLPERNSEDIMVYPKKTPNARYVFYIESVEE